jgi:transcriptional regulator
MPLSYEEEIEIRRETILELASKGWTQQAIAAKLGYSQAQIPKDLAVVREGIEAAGGTTVMISRQSNAKVDLYAKGVLASTQNVNIADQFWTSKRIVHRYFGYRACWTDALI